LVELIDFDVERYYPRMDCVHSCERVVVVVVVGLKMLGFIWGVMSVGGVGLGGILYCGLVGVVVVG
jgi:hypothetical protein